MKEVRIALAMTLIAASFSLILQGANASDIADKIIFSVGGIILFILTIRFWDSVVKEAKNKELEEKASRDNSTKAMNELANRISDLVNEIREDRTKKKE